MSKPPAVTAETNIGAKQRKTREVKPKEIPYEDLKAQALGLPILIRANLSKVLRESVDDESKGMEITARQAQELVGKV